MFSNTFCRISVVLSTFVVFGRLSSFCLTFGFRAALSPVVFLRRRLAFRQLIELMNTELLTREIARLRLVSVV